MIRNLTLTAALVGALALPASAEESKPTIEPGKGPTSTMTDQVPQMKGNGETTQEKLLPAAKAMDGQVPSMRPTDRVSGQADSKSSGSATTPSAQGVSLTDEESKGWIKKPVFSSDGKKIGEVVSFQRDAANQVVGMHADIGGYFGFGETRINVQQGEFALQGDRVVLSLTAEQASKLPAIRS